ncbi:hypothetical protein [Methanofollis aquaemaris]|nr:hypothetical protein [Methanofollis aquaemaris]
MLKRSPRWDLVGKEYAMAVISRLPEITRFVACTREVVKKGL